MKPRFFALFFSLFALQACILYVPDVEQGNIITPQMIGQVKAGQSRQQVRFALGTPLVKDSFHKNRWDYFYSIKKGRSKKVDKKRLTIIFKNDRVEKIVRNN